MIDKVNLDYRGFVYVKRLKICRYDPEQQVLEFKDHHKGGRLVEIGVEDFTRGLIEAIKLKGKIITREK